MSWSIPVGFLQIVLQDLQRSRLVTSRSGPKGGYALGRPPGSITVCEVVESLEGPLDAGECACSRRTVPLGRCLRAPQGLVVSTRGSAGTTAVGHARRSGGRGQGSGGRTASVPADRTAGSCGPPTPIDRGRGPGFPISEPGRCPGRSPSSEGPSTTVDPAVRSRRDSACCQPATTATGLSRGRHRRRLQPPRHGRRRLSPGC